MSRRRGSALLSVLWLSAALAAIGFALASTVRGEAERTSTAVDNLRSYYLAAGGIERAAVELRWAVETPANRVIPKDATYVVYEFPAGLARVDIIPEAAKLDVNVVPVLDLVRLLAALGVDLGHAGEIAAAIDDWRHPSEGSPFDAYYLSLTPSFHATHASFQEIEELLLVKGITPELFYGTYVPVTGAEQGSRLAFRPGLIDCLTVYGPQTQVDANTAQPAVLAALELTPYAISALVQRRMQKPFTGMDLGEFLTSVGAPQGRLRTGGHSMVTLRATAQLRLPDGRYSDLKRSAAALVKFGQWGTPVIDFLRWYDTAWSN